MSGQANVQSVLVDHIRAFLDHQRALGKRFDTEEAGLRQLERYLLAQQVTTVEAITPGVVEAFVFCRPRQPRSVNSLLSTLRRFFGWLVFHEVLVQSPLLVQPQCCPPPRRPFIFDRPQAQRLLEAAARLREGPHAYDRGPTYQLALTLMYALGLRVGEVARLCRQDVDLVRQWLVIRQTKFAKNRLVPFGPRLAAHLAAYLHHAEQLCSPLQPAHPFLSVTREKTGPLRSKAISHVFHQLVPQLNLTIPPGVEPPRAHHLRHSFAVGTLLRWYREGINPAERLLHLSTFLGHVDPSSTAVYLTITAELLQEASDRFARFAAPLLTEVHVCPHPL
jgi:site-specific recombinase XerD